MSSTQQCVHSGGKAITESTCFELVSSLSSAQLETCQQCPRGQALIRTTPGPIKRDTPSPAELAERKQLAPLRRPDELPREYVLRLAGCDTQKALAKKLGINQPTVSVLFGLLDAGTWPSTERHLLILQRLRITQPMLFPEAISDATAQLLDSTGAPAEVPPGDLAADLANPATIERLPGQDLPELNTDCEAYELLTQARAQAAPAAQDETADDEWREYTGRAPSKPSSPHLCIDKNGKMGLTVAAVREFGVSHGHWVDLLWNAPRRQIGIRVVSEQGRASLRVSGNPKCSRHQINGTGFWQQFGLRPVSGQYPIHRAPSGLLVATIELESEEAKAS